MRTSGWIPPLPAQTECKSLRRFRARQARERVALLRRIGRAVAAELAAELDGDAAREARTVVRRYVDQVVEDLERAAAEVDGLFRLAVEKAPNARCGEKREVRRDFGCDS